MNMNEQPTVIRTERGLTIAGTRITLYQIMDFLKADYAPEEILTGFRLTIKQMTEVMDYLDAHRDDVEAEYQHVVALAEANRRYWEARNQKRFERIAVMPTKPEHADLWRKLQTWKAQLVCGTVVRNHS